MAKNSVFTFNVPSGGNDEKGQLVAYWFSGTVSVPGSLNGFPDSYKLSLTDSTSFGTGIVTYNATNEEWTINTTEDRTYRIVLTMEVTGNGQGTKWMQVRLIASGNASFTNDRFFTKDLNDSPFSVSGAVIIKPISAGSPIVFGINIDEIGNNPSQAFTINRVEMEIYEC